MITLSTGSCQQGCKMPYLFVEYESSGNRHGYRLRGCGGPYNAGRDVPPGALRSLSSANRHGLPIESARLLASLQQEAQRVIARLIREHEVSREEGEAFLDEVFG